jgi:hypothetical protein
MKKKLLAGLGIATSAGWYARSYHECIEARAELEEIDVHIRENKEPGPVVGEDLPACSEFSPEYLKWLDKADIMRPRCK